MTKAISFLLLIVLSAGIKNTTAQSANKTNTITGNTTVCWGGIEAYCITNVKNTTRYEWTVPEETAIIEGANSSCILVQWGGTGGELTVKAINEKGEVDYITLPVKMNCRKVAEQNHEMENEMQVYPDPAKESVTLNFYSGESETCQLVLIDFTGRVVMQQTIITIKGRNELNLDLTTITNGIYTAIIKMEKEELVTRLIKN